MMAAVTTKTVLQACEGAKAASHALAGASTEVKDAALSRLAALLEENVDSILAANAADLADERASALAEALRDRLALDRDRVIAMAEGVRGVVSLPDPVGEVLERRTLGTGSTWRSDGCRSVSSR